MPKATECQLLVSIDQALLLRDSGNYVFNGLIKQMHCIECGKPVRPYRESVSKDAHFEHLDRNPDCSLSDPLI